MVLFINVRVLCVCMPRVLRVYIMEHRGVYHGVL